MRVLVTGASGVFGREIVGRLARSGHQVVATSRRVPAGLPAGVRHVAADIGDADAIARATEGCDVVAHCAWAVGALHDDDLERRINVGGTEAVLRAMARAGARRLVFASSSTAYGPRADDPGVDESSTLAPHPDHTYAVHKAEVEALLASSDVDAVTIRSAVVLGRHIDNRIWSFMAAPVQVAVRGRPPATWQVVHADDVGRFFVRCCEGGPTGPVNLAAPGTFTSTDLAAALGRRLVEVPESVLRGAVEVLWERRAFDVSPAEVDFIVGMPVMDTSKLTDDHGFRCAWSATEALEDTRLAVTGVAVVGPRVIELPWRSRFSARVPTGHDSHPDGDPLLVGRGLRAAGPTDAVFDRRLFADASHGVAAGTSIPVRRSIGAVVGNGVRALGLAVGASGDVDELAWHVARLERLAADPVAMDDARLEALVELADEIVVHGWRVAGRGAVAAHAAMTVARKLGAGPAGESVPWQARAAHRMAERYTGDRERAREHLVRAIGLLGGMLRERAGRLVAAGVLQRADDIWYLTIDEARTPPDDVEGLVARRRAERAGSRL